MSIYFVFGVKDFLSLVDLFLIWLFELCTVWIMLWNISGVLACWYEVSIQIMDIEIGRAHV